MDAAATPAGLALDPRFVSLAALGPGAVGHVVAVGSHGAALSGLERRLLEFGFVHGEQVEPRGRGVGRAAPECLPRRRSQLR